MEYFFIVTSILIGIVLGSFLNVVIHRLPRGWPAVSPPVHCPACGAGRAARDLVPLLGYLWLGGKCRSCRGRIPVRYPLVELLTGAIFAAVYLVFGLGLEGIVALFLLCLLLVVALVDLDHRRIPNPLVAAGLAVGVLFHLVAVAGSYLDLPYFAWETGWQQGVLGFLAGGIIMLVIYLASRGGMGGGDLKLIAMIGLFVGVKGVVLVLLLSILAGGVFALALLITGRKGRRDSIPFGPFISLAAAVYLFGGEFLWEWYLGVLPG